MKKTLLLLILLIISCSEKIQKEPTQYIELPVNPEHTCIDKIVEIEQQPNQLQQKLIDNRFGLFLHAKTTSVLFVKEPLYELTDNKTTIMYRNVIAEKNQWGNIDRLIPAFEKIPKYGRESLLKDGYLYTDNNSMAYALGQLVNPSMLFNTPEIWISRGATLMKAERRKFGYYFVDGPFVNEKVTLNLFDRITDSIPTDSYLIDLQLAQHTYKFNQITIKHIGDKTVTAVLTYDSFNTKALFDRDGAKLKLFCTTDSSAELNDAIKISKAPLQNLRQAILNQIIERIPFDEPKHEYGNQLDGYLRPSWEAVYFSGRSGFSFNGDRYSVYDHLGRPTPPQVCVDFVVDSFDRASGSWYSNKGEKPTRNIGSFNSKEYDYTFRNVDGITKFALDHPEWFEIRQFEKNVSIGNDSFYDYVKSQKFEVGDIIFIHGKTPWDPIDMHSHSFFIYEVDPITQFPTLLAGNAGPASLRPWEIETRRTPDRYIVMSLRLTEKFLHLLNGNKSFEELLVIK